MSTILGPLSDDDVRQIAQLIESLDRSTFDFLQLEQGDLKLTIGKGTAPLPQAAPASSAPSPAPVVADAPPVAVSVAAPAAAVKSSPAPAAPARQGGVPAGLVAITSPIMGRYYAQPEPGAAPFVSIGDEVHHDTTVGLVEVMKVFNAIAARVEGVITEILVQDAEILEFGQPMFLVRPSDAGMGTAAGAAA